MLIMMIFNSNLCVIGMETMLEIRGTYPLRSFSAADGLSYSFYAVVVVVVFVVTVVLL